MRESDYPGSLRRDYKLESKGLHRATLDDDLEPVLDALVNDQAPEAKYRDS